MTVANMRAQIGGNFPPDPMDEALAPYLDAITEAENWLDGTTVEDEPAMLAVDALIADIRSAKGALGKAKKSATAPLHDAWKAEIARWKPTEDDIERRLKGLAAVVDPFKRQLAEEKEAAKRAAYAEAQRQEREARSKAALADEKDYAAQVAAAEAMEKAIDAKAAAAAANKDTVKGLRTVHLYEITDHKAALHWIAAQDRDAMTDFIAEYVRRNFKTKAIAGVKTWSEKQAY